MLDELMKKKIGQMMMCGFPSPYLDDHAKKLIDELYIGNFVLFTRNIGDQEAVRRLTSDLSQYTLRKLDQQPFIAIDEECGMVRRLHGVTTPFPGSLATAATVDPVLAGQIGEMLGKELLAAGINMDFAPDIDINVNPNNPVIGMRSYGDNPESVAAFGMAMAEGLTKSGVIPVYKHFPGHGDTAVDSHHGMPTVEHNMERLHEVELYPFIKAIETKAECIMVSHLLFNAIDFKNPATLSKKVVQNFLKDHLGFEGIAITDCMEMGAIIKNYGIGEACVRAVLAGIDLVLVSHTYKAQKAAVEAVYNAVESGRISSGIIDRAIERIESMKTRLLKLNARMDYKPAGHMDFATKIYEKSITLAHGELPRIKEDEWICLGVKAFQGTPAEDLPAHDLDFTHEVSKAVGCQGLSFDIELQDELIDELVQKTATKSGVVLGIGDAHRFQSQRKLYKKLHEAGKRLVVVSLRMPYDMIGMNKPEAHLCTYEYTPMALDVICKVLKGEMTPNGSMPLKL